MNTTVLHNNRYYSQHQHKHSVQINLTTIIQTLECMLCVLFVLFNLYCYTFTSDMFILCEMIVYPNWVQSVSTLSELGRFATKCETAVSTVMLFFFCFFCKTRIKTIRRSVVPAKRGSSQLTLKQHLNNSNTVLMYHFYVYNNNIQKSLKTL